MTKDFVPSEVFKKVQSGELAGSGTAARMPDVVCQLVCFKALTSNVGDVYIGTSSAATVAAGTTDVTSGLEISPGEFSPWIPVSNLNMFWYICDNAGDDLTYMALG